MNLILPQDFFVMKINQMIRLIVILKCTPLENECKILHIYVTNRKLFRVSSSASFYDLGAVFSSRDSAAMATLRVQINFCQKLFYPPFCWVLKVNTLMYIHTYICYFILYTFVQVFKYFCTAFIRMNFVACRKIAPFLL